MEKSSNFLWIQDTVVSINSLNNTITLESGKTVDYTKICFCTGAQPKKLDLSSLKNNECKVHYLRDLDSVEKLANTLDVCKKSVAIVGSGGIAFDLVQQLRDVVEDLHWFYLPEKTHELYFDEVGLEFLLSSNPIEAPKETATEESSFQVFTRKCTTKPTRGGVALGETTWKDLLPSKQSDKIQKHRLHLHTEQFSASNVKKLNIQLICIAIGVEPTIPPGVPNLNVNINMSLPDNEQIFAAGDCCTVNWPEEENPYWFQMRLWSQAAILGKWAGICMHQKQEQLDFAFNTFAHVTKAFGHKIIYLGLYRECGPDVKFLYRVKKHDEYIKFIVRNSRVIGAVLIGETDMEEVAENLIQNELNIGALEDDLLNPDIELDHYFD